MLTFVRILKLGTKSFFKLDLYYFDLCSCGTKHCPETLKIYTDIYQNFKCLVSESVLQHLVMIITKIWMRYEIGRAEKRSLCSFHSCQCDIM